MRVTGQAQFDFLGDLQLFYVFFWKGLCPPAKSDS